MSLQSEPRFRRQLPAERRESILSAAAQMFGAMPYEQVSLADIATAAGIARGLVNHYFGTKRQLYLEVVRKAATVPLEAVSALPPGDVDGRVGAAVDWFLDELQRSGKSWLRAMSGGQGMGRDVELEEILVAAENESVDLLIEALGLGDAAEDMAKLRAMIRPYGQLARAAGREWLFKNALTRQEARVLMVTTLSAIVGEVRSVGSSSTIRRTTP